ncbi:2-dehydro-3-deoxygalactonokinase [Sphingomonas bacterium]|uniref:2-dehydro-3-deoxygalactonokinase n=1 Tax=Sphingomonas bacterium TaxID=1895847 RepID=UPI0015768D3F|nr:2-dehydro-3-deoxygalactonokinase [Sphingomonas bacterium]
MSYRVVGDWGTSRLRLFRIESGVVTDRCEAPGIGTAGTPPEAVLRETLAQWRAAGDPSAIALCGMVGSRNGWVEVPYVECPADQATWITGAARLALDDIPVAILAGLATKAGVPDVMRGEETQTFGAVALDPRLADGRHRVILPGTHSKWTTIEDGRITGFRTYLTGELFASLRDHSILARAAAGSTVDPGEEDIGFAHGLDRSRSGRVIGALFEARSAQLLEGRSHGWALGYLSGLLIGGEIAEALHDEPPTGRIALVGDPRLTERYRRTFAGYAIAVELVDGDAAALAGLNALETES